jgi:microcystin degradation protein MlrC
VPYHTYPHTDFFTTGERAARLLLRILDGEMKPVTARVAIPALVRGDQLITATGMFGRQIRMAEVFEAAGGASAGMFIGNPFTDVPELRCNSVVVSNDDIEGAVELAEAMANDFWVCHEQMQVPLTSLFDAAKSACDRVLGTTILVDAADATSSGASGDSNAILRALIEARYAGQALLPIVDAPAVQAAFAAGVGATLRIAIGGALDKKRFSPIDMTLKVRMLSDGDFVSESDGAVWHAGLTAVLQDAHYTIIATSRAVSLYNRSLFYAHGCDPAKYECVVVKSPQCERHMFRDWSARYIDVDAPGSTSANVRSLGHTIAQRPLWPLDAVDNFTAKAQVFRRQR